MGNWPSAAGIDALIERANAGNGTRSKLTGYGARFLQLGKEYGVNPGVVAAMLERESQLGADGSYLPSALNNFGGVTGTGNGGTEFFRDRNWAKYTTADEGLRANFALLDAPNYQATGGKFARVMDVYSPVGDGNPRGDMWSIFNTVSDELAIPLDETTNIYAGDDGKPSQVSGTFKASGIVSGYGLGLPNPGDFLSGWLSDIVSAGLPLLRRMAYIGVGLGLLWLGVRQLT